MPLLEIVYVNINDDPPDAPNWRIQVANTPDSFLFQGDTADAQQLEITTMANMMREFDTTPQGLLEMLPHMIEIPPNMNVADVMDVLFTDTDELAYGGDLIYEVPEEGDVLLEFMVDAGEALWEVLLL